MKKILLSLLLTLPASLSLFAQWDLNRCLEFTKENNKELLAQKERISVSNYEKKIAISKFIPEMNFSMESDYYWKIPVESYPGEIFGLTSERVTIATGTKLSGNYGININWNLIDVQQWQNIKLEKLKGQSSKYGVQSLQKLLLRNVTAAYYNVQIQKHNIALSIDLLEQHTQIHGLLTRQFEEGLLDKISMNQSAAILSDYQKYQSEQEILYQRCLLELKYWMGYPFDESIDILSVNDITVTELNSTEFNSEYLPDYNQQESLLNIAYHQFKASKYFMMPRLSLVSSFGQVGFGDNLREFGNSSYWHSNGFVGFRLSIPLFSSQGINTVKRNQAIYNQTSLEFAGYQDRETKRFFQVKLELEKTQTTLSSQETIRELAEENLILCHQKIEQGVIDMIQLNQVQQELIRSIEVENNARLESLKCQIELKYLQNEIY
jgi:outer membrane protein TolC